MKAYAPSKRVRLMNCKVFGKKIQAEWSGDFFFKTLYNLARAVAAYLCKRFY